MDPWTERWGGPGPAPPRRYDTVSWGNKKYQPASFYQCHIKFCHIFCTTSFTFGEERLLIACAPSISFLFGKAYFINRLTLSFNTHSLTQPSYVDLFSVPPPVCAHHPGPFWIFLVISTFSRSCLHTFCDAWTSFLLICYFNCP